MKHNPRKRLGDLLNLAKQRAAGELPPPRSAKKKSRSATPHSTPLDGQIEEVRAQRRQIRRLESWHKFRKDLPRNFLIVCSIILIGLAWSNRESLPGLIEIGKIRGSELVTKLVPQGQTLINGSPQAPVVSGTCQTINLVSDDSRVGIQSGFPQMGDQPTSWCPSDPALWASLVGGSKDRLASDIVSKSGLSTDRTTEIAGALEASATTGRLELPSKNGEGASQEAPPPSTATPEPPPVPTEVVAPDPTQPPPEPTISPTPQPTMAPTAIVLINRNFSAREIGKFLADYGLPGLTSGPINCKTVDLQAIKLYYANDTEKYIVGDLSPLGLGLRTEGCTGITVLTNPPANAQDWVGLNGAWFRPFRQP